MSRYTDGTRSFFACLFVFVYFILPECWNIKVSYWIEPLHVLKCLHFSAVLTQYCNKIREDVPCLLLSSCLLFLAWFSIVFVKGLRRSFAWDNLQKGKHTFEYASKCSAKGTYEVVWQFTTDCRLIWPENTPRVCVCSCFMCAFCQISFLSFSPSIGFVSPFNNGLANSAAPHKKKKVISIFNYHAKLRLDAA